MCQASAGAHCKTRMRGRPARQSTSLLGALLQPYVAAPMPDSAWQQCGIQGYMRAWRRIASGRLASQQPHVCGSLLQVKCGHPPAGLRKLSTGRGMSLPRSHTTHMLFDRLTAKICRAAVEAVTGLPGRMQARRARMSGGSETQNKLQQTGLTNSFAFG